MPQYQIEPPGQPAFAVESDKELTPQDVDYIISQRPESRVSPRYGIGVGGKPFLKPSSVGATPPVETIGRQLSQGLEDIQNPLVTLGRDTTEQETAGMGPLAKSAIGAGEGAKHFTESLTSPLSIATLGTGRALAKAYPWISRALSGVFGAQMTKQAAEEAGDLAGLPKDQRDAKTVAKHLANIALTGGTAGLAAYDAGLRSHPAVQQAAQLEQAAKILPKTAAAVKEASQVQSKAGTPATPKAVAPTPKSQSPDAIVRGLMEKNPPSPGQSLLEFLKSETVPTGVNKSAETIVEPPPVGAKNAPTETPQAQAKEPWQMTKAQFVASDEPTTIKGKDVLPTHDWMAEKYLTDLGGKKSLKDAYGAVESPEFRHAELVAQALREGKPVPAEVLADYPDLAKPEAKPAPGPATEGPGKSRISEIDAELAQLQKLYETKSKRFSKSGMVPPSIKGDALKSISDKMDKLDAEKKSLQQPDSASKPVQPPAKAESEKGQMGLPGAEATGKEITPKTPLETINSTPKVKVTAPEGATMLRGTTKDRKSSVQPIKSFAKGNPFHRSDITKLEAGTIDKTGKFKPIAGDVKVEPIEKGPGIAGMGGADPSQFAERQTAMQELRAKLTKPFRMAVNTAKIAMQTRGVKQTMAMLKDVGENTARVFARQQSNDIRNPIKRVFGKDAAKAHDALSFYVEAGGGKELPPEQVSQNLRDAIDKMRDSKVAGEKWRDKGIDAANFALYHQEELADIAKRYNEITTEQVSRENKGGVDTLKRGGYVMHLQDLQDESLGWFDRKGGGEAAPFRKNRTHATFADSISAGIDPKTLNAVDLLERRLANGEMLVNNRAWVDTFRDTVDPKTGKPIFDHVQYEERPDGTKYPIAPQGYSLEQLGPQHVAVQNGYEGVARALTDPSLFSKHLGTRVLMSANAVGKSGRLAIDTFHVGRIAMWQMALRASGLEKPFPSYRKGLILLDYTPSEITKMGENGEIPKEWVKPLQNAKPAHELMLKSGYNVGRITDNLHQEWIRATPVLGRFNKWVFDEFTRGAMSELWQSEFKRLKEARPQMDDKEAARTISKDMNTRMGNLGRQGWFKSRTFQDAAKLVALAPQWNEGLIMSELGALRQAGKLITDTAQGKRFYAGTLLRAVGGMATMTFVVNQAINYITRGKPTWENEEEGIGAKLSAWIPDPKGGPGFFLNPLSLPAETADLLLRRFERDNNLLDPINDYIRSRLSYAAAPANIMWQRKDQIGRPVREGDVMKEMAKSTLPIPIGFGTYARALVGENDQKYQGEFASQAVSRFGLKLQQAPSNEQRISHLADKFKSSKGITPSAEFYSGDYTALTSALRLGNVDAAKKELAALRRKKTDDAIEKHYHRWSGEPFTGSKARESEFKETLSEEQLRAYDAAKEEREKVARAYQNLLESQP